MEEEKSICFDSDSLFLQIQNLSSLASLSCHCQTGGYVNLGDPEHTHFNRVKLLFSNCFLPTFLFLSVLSIFITRLKTTVILSVLFSFSPQTKLLCPSFAAAAAAESRQSCPTLRDPMDCSPPDSSVHGILQERVLGWGAIAFSVPKVYCITFLPFC